MHDRLHVYVYVYGFEEYFGIGILPKGLTFQDFAAPKFNFWVPSSFVQWFVSNPNVKRKECFPIPHQPIRVYLYTSQNCGHQKNKWFLSTNGGRGPIILRRTHMYSIRTCYIYWGMPKL